jgi:hypothetical protein
MKPAEQQIMRHSFAIKVLDRLPGLFQPHRYLYYCARCKWAFLVNDGARGVLTAIDSNGLAIDGDEAARRAATFALGPCPSLQILRLVPRRDEQTQSATAEDPVPIPLALRLRAAGWIAQKQQSRS